MPNITTTLDKPHPAASNSPGRRKRTPSPRPCTMPSRKPSSARTADPDIRVITLTGSGDSFCAGNDLNSFLSDPGSDSAARFIRAIATAQAPIVAAVNGVAVGVGVTMLLHCDLVYAAADARFNFAFIDLGLLPEAGSTYLLPRMLGYGRAAELLMLGEAFGAETARECGIVNAVVPAEALDETGPVESASSWRPNRPRPCGRPKCCCGAAARRR